MSNVLFLAHRIPFPPDKGDKIRSYNLLKYLCDEHRIYLGAFVDDPADIHYRRELDAVCADVFLCPLTSWRSRLGAATALPRGRSLSVGYYRDQRMREWVATTLKRQQIDAVVSFSSTMAQYFPLSAGAGPVLIADFVDVDSDKWRQYAKESAWPMSVIYGYEARALAKWEETVLKQAHAVSVVAEAERQIVPGLSTKTQDKVRVVPNGVDTEFFDPDGDWPNPYNTDRKVVVFTGAMDYFANIDGVCWFANDVWPEIRARQPDAEFFIVGSKPVAAVSALAARPGIKVTGRVPDVRPYLRHASVAVAPLRLARGVQNKVLEALAMNRPVVATSQALRGLHGERPGSALQADSAEKFARTLIDVLTRPELLSTDAGRAYVLEYFGWKRNLATIGELIPSRHAKAEAPAGHPAAQRA